MRYEVGICIATGWIVWFHGPFPCGWWPDLAIANTFLHYNLLPNEYYIADNGYITERALTPVDAINPYELEYMANCRARHEQLNRLFKQFNCIQNTFKREVKKHGLFAHSVANIIQLGIMAGEVNIFNVNERIAPPYWWM